MDSCGANAGIDATLELMHLVHGVRPLLLHFFTSILESPDFGCYVLPYGSCLLMWLINAFTKLVLSAGGFLLQLPQLLLHIVSYYSGAQAALFGLELFHY